jgi:endonuclease/exonuclease/phosphatase family metal-dependent hydrolase
MDYPSPIPLLPVLLQRRGEHIVLGDFNLHHPLWSGLGNPTIHLAAEPLIEMVYGAGLSLITPPGQPTWRARTASSTIDLTFVSEGLIGKVQECRVKHSLDHGSDHLPVATTFYL